MSKFLLCLLLLATLMNLSSCRKPEPEPTPQTDAGPVFRHDADLTITAPDGILRASFAVEIAATEQATRQGLMFRESMPADHAMLFDPQGLSRNPFWMKNTYLPLDIIFIDADRKILHIAENTHPFSEDAIEPGGLYRYVLEINAGLAQKQNLTIGDKVTWTLLNSAGS